MTEPSLNIVACCDLRDSPYLKPPSPFSLTLLIHEISKFLDSETYFLLNKCRQSASLFNFKGKKKSEKRGVIDPGILNQ